MEGTTYIVTLAVQKILAFSKIIFLNLLDPNQTVFWTAAITRLRLELSHLREHKFKYNFQNCLNPLCSSGSSIESTYHFLLHCPIFHDKSHTLLSTLNNIDSKLLEPNDSYLTQTLLFGSTSFDSETNTFVLNATIDYILSTERFEEHLF